MVTIKKQTMVVKIEVLKKILYFKEPTHIYMGNNIPPLLRFFHIQDISPLDGIHTEIICKKSSALVDGARTYVHTILTYTTENSSTPDKETRVPYKICSFDIEASSSHGDFPVPIKSKTSRKYNGISGTCR